MLYIDFVWIGFGFDLVDIDIGFGFDLIDIGFGFIDIEYYLIEIKFKFDNEKYDIDI